MLAGIIQYNPLINKDNLPKAMKHIQTITWLIIISIGLIGCSNTPAKSTATQPVYSTNKAAVKSKLKHQHREWKGAPYKYGGLSKRGIDCSGFVYITYRNKFGIDLPRTTELQSKTGVQIRQHQLTTGDLVFFKTGFTKKHVGIYMGDRKFLHASTSKGVTISSLDNVYWRDKYWKSQRI